MKLTENKNQFKKMSKSLILFATLAFGLFLSACGGDVKNEAAEVDVDEAITRIEVLDFHSTHRCMTCNAIEENTKYTLETYFAKEMKDNRITFQTINVDDEENLAIAEKFQASGTALILNVINNGKETQLDLTDFAFMQGNDKEVFSTELKAKIEHELKAL
jgi:ABC-type glycerol-3-phosphate transport system substrate-binding protein